METINPKRSRYLAKLAFPDYKGRKFFEQRQERPMSLSSYWDGGSCDKYAVVNLDTLEVSHAPSSHPCFDKYGKAAMQERVVIPVGFVIVKRTYFCGKEFGLTVIYPALRDLTVELLPA